MRLPTRTHPARLRRDARALDLLLSLLVDELPDPEPEPDDPTSPAALLTAYEARCGWQHLEDAL